MPYYIVNKEEREGDHEVHETTCSHLPSKENQIDLGWHSNCKPAVEAAKTLYSNADGCKHCSEPCHRG